MRNFVVVTTVFFKTEKWDLCRKIQIGQLCFGLCNLNGTVEKRAQTLREKFPKEKTLFIIQKRKAR